MRRRELLKVASAAAIEISTCPFGWAAAAEKKKRNVLYFTRSVGFEHSVVRRQGNRLSCSEEVLIEMGQVAGFDVQCSKDGRVFEDGLDPYDAVAFYTCGDLTKLEQGNTPPITPAGKQKLLDAIMAGKGFVGFHSAGDSFHSRGPGNEAQAQLDPYIAMLGGESVAYGPQQEASLIISSQFPGIDDLGCAEGISFTDEWYALKSFATDLQVILVQETRFMKGDCYQRPNFPCTWARMHGKGRVFYTSMGHGEDIWSNPFFQTIVRGGLTWAMGSVEAKLQPNLAQVTPQANRLARQAASMPGGVRMEGSHPPQTKPS
jgi:uncharacterized protein